jgi:hypothetical protein
MTLDPRIQQSGTVLQITSQTDFQNFQSLTLIDAGASDGFNLAGGDGNFSFIPTGIVVNLGGGDGRAPAKFTVQAASGKSLNVTAILYQ